MLESKFWSLAFLVTRPLTSFSVYGLLADFLLFRVMGCVLSGARAGDSHRASPELAALLNVHFEIQPSDTSFPKHPPPHCHINTRAPGDIGIAFQHNSIQTPYPLLSYRIGSGT